MCRNSHDGAGAITHKHIVGYPDRNFGPIEWIYGVTTGKDPGFAFGQIGPVKFAFHRCRVDVVGNSSFLCRRGNFCHQFVFRSYNHVSGAEKRIRAGSVNTKFFVVTGEGEIDLGTRGTSDPVALHLLDPFRPVEAVEPFQQTFGIVRNAKHPLFQEAAFDLLGATFFV